MFDYRNPGAVEDIVNLLSMIVLNYKVEDFSVELFRKVYLILDVRYWSEIDLNVLLMSKKIISVSEWDNLMSMVFNQQGSQMPDTEL